MREIKAIYRGQYAFIGIGSHSRQNLYPIIGYLHIPLKYICCTDKRKLPLIEKIYPNVKATACLDDILTDNDISGVFVSVSPAQHYEIARQILSAGKNLFVEKPPCSTLDELKQLITLQKESRVECLVGLQKRYAPAVAILKKSLSGQSLINYHFRYAIGPYLEGNPILEMFIHPIDLVCYIFGEAEIQHCSKISSGKGETTILITLRHNCITGQIELTTASSWSKASEIMRIYVHNGEYELTNMNRLIYTPSPKRIFGIPSDKLFSQPLHTVELFSTNPFIPTASNNNLIYMGYAGEIEAFVKTAEHIKSEKRSSLTSLLPIYSIIEKLTNFEIEMHDKRLTN